MRVVVVLILESSLTGGGEEVGIQIQELSR
jgi:hypothetical protein